MDWSVVKSDAVQWLESLEDDSADLLLTSPPYELARTYGLDSMVGGQAWVDWMVAVVRAAAPKVKGLIAIVCEGQTRKYRYSCVPFLLIADLHRAGFNLRKPAAFRRVGIPGSGGPDWLRNDYEPIVCITRRGKLPWSDNTACGHPPKWAPGGEMSYRNSDGSRTNQWGGGAKSGAERKPNGTRGKAGRPSHKMTSKRLERGNPKGSCRGRRVTSGHVDGDTPNSDSYLPPVLANPGNVPQQTYTADEVAKMLGEPSDVITCKVGGGLMGHALAHENEAPYPLTLAEFFVRSFCPPGGLVLDPFAGSGTTLHAAIKWGRNASGCDVRQSQVDLCHRRLKDVPAELFA